MRAFTFYRRVLHRICEDEKQKLAAVFHSALCGIVDGITARYKGRDPIVVKVVNMTDFPPESLHPVVQFPYTKRLMRL